MNLEHAQTTAVGPYHSTAAKVLSLAWPVIVEQVLGTTIGLINTYIMGHLGAAALATVGLSSQVQALFVALFSAVGVGSTALVARHVGAGEHGEARRLTGQSLLLAVTVGLIAALPCLLLGRQILTLLGGAEEVIALGRPYLFAMGTGMPLMAVLLIGNAALRGSGDTRTPMLVMGLVNVINVMVAVSLVHGLGPLPRLGVLGGGVGSATGMSIGGLIIGAVLLHRRSHSSLRVPLSFLRFEPARAWRLLRIGLPAGAEQLLLQLGQLTMATVVTRLGTAAYAGHQLGIQLLAIAFMPGFAFSVAATALVGQELGQKQPAQAAAVTRTAAWIAGAIMCSLGTIAGLLAEPLLRIFTNDAAVIAQGIYAVHACAVMQPSLALFYVFAGALRGAGDTRFVLLAQTASVWLVRLPLAFRLGLTFELGLVGVWAGMIIDICARAAMLVLRFRGGAWKHIRV